MLTVKLPIFKVESTIHQAIIDRKENTMSRARENVEVRYMPEKPIQNLKTRMQCTLDSCRHYKGSSPEFFFVDSYVL